MRPLIILLAIALLLPAQDDIPLWQQWLTRGMDAFRAANFPEAVAALEKVVEMKPDDLRGHSYLGNACMALFVPGDNSAKNRELATRAENEFARVLSVAPQNKPIILALGSLNYQRTQGNPDLKQALIELDKARHWYEMLVQVDPDEKQAYSALGAIAWTTWYPQWINARIQSSMKLTDPGPLSDAMLRQQLRGKYDFMLDGGIANLTKALQIDPGFSEAMDYLSLLLRERADLKDTKEEYERDIQKADQWRRKARETETSRAVGVTVAIAPPRPLVGRQLVPLSPLTPARRVDPVYPPLARDSSIEGTVRLRALVGKDGRVRNLQFVSGNLLLLLAARDAVQQWLYEPTQLQGVAVDVQTDAAVRFALPSAPVPAATR